MKINDNYHNYSNRKPYNNIPCKSDEELLPVVLNSEIKESLGKTGYDPKNAETWHFPHAKESIPVIFVPHKIGSKKKNMKWFNREIERYLKHDDFTDKKTLSLDKSIDDVENDGECDFDPTGTTENEDTAFLLQVLDELIKDVELIDPQMGEIIRLLYASYTKGEIIKKIDLNKGKTKSYAFIEKAQKTALNIFINNYH